MTSTRIAILQSAYIPWRGYFDIIRNVDLFVLYEDAQYSRGDWRNRNRILAQDGERWLTIPVRTSGCLGQRIADVAVLSGRWATKHWNAIRAVYGRAPHFDSAAALLQPLYNACTEESHLSACNETFLRGVAKGLGLGTGIVRSEAFNLDGDRVERLVSICREAGAVEYVTGPAARSYLDERVFRHHGIRLRWFQYNGYPAYAQLHASSFVDRMSIVDVLANAGTAGTARLLERSSGPFDD